MFDLIIRGGTVYDGQGGKPFSADVALSGSKISEVGDLTDVVANRVLDATGLSLMPGCIDAHSHSDLTLPTHNRAESSIRQGITTEVAGSCGWSMAPCKRETIDGVLKYLLDVLMSDREHKETAWDWRTFGEYLQALEKKRIGTNLVPIVGQSLIRAHIVGTENRPASKAEIGAMKCLVREAMESGAVGISTGRSYEPGGFADTDEIIELAKVVAEFDGVYTTHMKNEGEHLFEAVDEAIEIGRKAEISVQVSHHKAVGRANFGKVSESLSMMERARREGIRIACDVYPYDFAQVSMLWRLLPKEIQNLGAAVIFEKLQSASFRSEIRAADERAQNRLQKSAGDYLVVSAPDLEEAEWKTLTEIAGTKDVVDSVCEVLQKSRMRAKYAAMMDENDVRTVLSHPITMVGTDAFALDRNLGDRAAIHPRHFGTFPRVLGHYARDQRLLPLEEMVKKVTSMPADKFGLRDRGRIKTGYAADLVVFDPATIVDRATAGDPYACPDGIKYVIINGAIALENGTYAPVLAGKVLKAR